MVTDIDRKSAYIQQLLSELDSNVTFTSEESDHIMNLMSYGMMAKQSGDPQFIRTFEYHYSELIAILSKKPKKIK